ncbi:aldehyde dehydrogenase family protein [Rhodococcus sp. SMB37]|uniref:aldehyde dehydrogenase family protein n=1 Tax=Rhodococcus sp. SMB37 TaxID=2512213 RepID=UPI00104DBB6C|nr:aldehyde dehydrogenase family protein [Rhodococcus sp. SMB37]
MLIDGQLVDAASGRVFENINPATAAVIGITVDAAAEDADAAVGAARRAFDSTNWATDAQLRRRVLHQLADVLEKHAVDLGAVVTAEAGAPVALHDRMQIGPGISALRWAADLASTYEYERHFPTRSSLGTETRPLMRKEPAGVVAAITPWNYPFYLNMTKIAPALAAGCTVVLKPAPDTPWSATMIGKLAVEYTDMPAGVLNIVTSSDNAVGEALTTDPRVDVVTFTGSTATGRRILTAVAPTVKRTLLELGGKSAAIVLPDADLQAAIPYIAGSVCSHAGQGCALTTRLLLPRSRYAEGLQLARTVMENLVPGDPTDPATLIGPVISRTQFERVLSYMELGRTEGRVMVGGGRSDRYERGFFLNPMLIADVDPGARIAQEEIFGPVLVAIPYDTEEEAVEIANNSLYGLSGSVFGADVAHAVDIARRIRAGTIAVNGAAFMGDDVPFGGYRQSGLGREHGVEGFEEFLETKSIGVPA